MTIEGEAAADLLTAAVAAKAVEPDSGKPPSTRARPDLGEPASSKRGDPGGQAVPDSSEPLAVSTARDRVCLNCGAGLSGAYCASCGQPAHIHRTFRSLGHDVLHAVFHFEGKFWRTMPELALRPGRLTRRYIDGERAKFVSPMALFLFTVFVMYAVFAFLPDLDWEDPPPPPALTPLGPVSGGLENAAPDDPRAAINAIQLEIDDLRRELDDTELAGIERSELELELRNLELSQAMLRGSATGASEGSESRTEEPEAAGRSETEELTADEGPQSELRKVFRRAAKKIEENPDLVFYKMKSNGYKWSWLLVPLSIPFVWVLFLWRREFPLYDHAVFVTYSISFMMMLLILSTLAQLVGAGGTVQAVLLMIVPPLHLYKQLRGTYGLSRPGAFVRLLFLLASALIVLTIFVTTLLLFGALE